MTTNKPLKIRKGWISSQSDCTGQSPVTSFGTSYPRSYKPKLSVSRLMQSCPEEHAAQKDQTALMCKQI